MTKEHETLFEKDSAFVEARRLVLTARSWKDYGQILEEHKKQLTLEEEKLLKEYMVEVLRTYNENRTQLKMSINTAARVFGVLGGTGGVVAIIIAIIHLLFEKDPNKVWDLIQSLSQK